VNRTVEQLVEQIPGLRRYARALVGDKHQADDLVQDCLARALSRLGLWTAGSDMRAWLFTIMHNLFVNHCRKQGSQPPLFALDEVAEQPRKGEQTDQLLHLSDLENGLRALSHEQREVLLLVSLEGLSYQQVAEVLNIPIGTVMSRLHRGRNQLRAWMDGESRDVAGLRSVK
jgi:RNA polymerase sigma-70 factor (ECF subfamily)